MSNFERRSLIVNSISPVKRVSNYNYNEEIVKTPA